MCVVWEKNVLNGNGVDLDLKYNLAKTKKKEKLCIQDNGTSFYTNHGKQLTQTNRYLDQGSTANDRFGCLKNLTIIY